MTETESKALALAISDLKKKALAAKQDGNVDEAVKLLKQAKSLEAVETNEFEEIDSPLYWKRLAVLYKQSGDIDCAKKSLIRAKQLEAETSKSTESNDENEDVTEAATNEQSTADTAEDTAQDGDLGSEEDIDEGLLDELDANTDEIDLDSLNVKFSDAEMMDEEMMVEFRLGGMPIPSQGDYANKVLEYKKKALAFKKANNISKATENLRTAKKLEKVQLALKHMDEGLGLRIHDDPQGWIETLNAEESSLLGELLQSNEAPDGHMVIHDAQHDKLGVDELENMDDEEVIEFVEMMGESCLPSVSQLQEEASQQKKKALEYKQAGNIDMAKVTLVDSKKTHAQADRLISILARMKDGNAPKEVSVQDLESMVDGERKQVLSQTVKQKALKDPWLSKPSAEIKKEVIRLKNEKKVKEATELMKKLKLVLQKEKEQAEAEKCARLIDEIQERLNICESQIVLWQYFEWFVDASTGNEQYLGWSQFASQCRQVIQVVKEKGSSSVTITTLPKVVAKLYFLPEDPVEIVERGMCGEASPLSSLNGALEVAVMDLLDMHKNEKLQKVLQKHNGLKIPQLRVEAKVHLPLQQEGDSSTALQLSFVPTKSGRKGKTLVYGFNLHAPTSRHRLVVPRGDSKQAKTIVRRMETKTIQFGVYFVHPREAAPETKTKSSWFFGHSKPDQKPVNSDTDDDKDVLLGKATVELQQLLSRNSIARDIPLMVNSRALGGAIRICLRTSPPFDPERFEGPLDGKLPNVRTYEGGLLFKLNVALDDQVNVGQA